MRQYVQEITQVLHLMSEQELKDSIEKLCRYLLSKYRVYYIDDFDDDTTKPVFDTVRTGEYTIRLSGRTITCQNIHSNHGTLSLVSISLPFKEGAGVGSSLPLTALKGKTNHIVVVKALIEMVNGLHQAEERMFGC